MGASAREGSVGALTLAQLARVFDGAIYPVNPNYAELQGLPCHPDLASLPGSVHGVSIVTPPAVTARVLDEAVALGIRHVWMQPGAEDPAGIERAEQAGLSVIAWGPCILVELSRRR